ncbi:unnamed protein product [Paramecium pentaurelia]|uniref:Uncharacterized protein n=1 Tax=Paramecium pentaurelia TaxID=43138 RepID=A0A8S1T8B3_9CILI|nr:unnamed protein product [Paramecium pentaurelia]
MISQQLHKQQIQFQQQQITPTMHLKGILQELPKETLFQKYMKSRLNKKQNRNLNKSPELLPLQPKNIINQTTYVIKNKQCSLKNKVKKYLTEVDSISTTKVVQRKNPFIKKKKSENWNDLDGWNVIDETFYQ